MSERLCGYCRNVGHRKPDCPLFAEQRNEVLTHTPIQRLALINALGKLGLGIGAMFKIQQWYDKSEYIGMIKDFDFVKDANFIEARNIRCTSKVVLKQLDVNKDFMYRRVYVRYLKMGNGSAEDSNMGLCISEELAAAANGRSVLTHDKYELVSPSNDIDFDPSVLVKNISMPRRLCLTKELHNMHGFTGIMPTLHKTPQ